MDDHDDGDLFQCSFCGQAPSGPDTLIAGPHGVFICGGCVLVCGAIVEQGRGAPGEPPDHLEQALRPRAPGGPAGAGRQEAGGDRTGRDGPGGDRTGGPGEAAGGVASVGDVDWVLEVPDAAWVPPPADPLLTALVPTRDRLEALLGREPTIAELAAELGVDGRTVMEALFRSAAPDTTLLGTPGTPGTSRARSTPSALGTPCAPGEDAAGAGAPEALPAPAAAELLRDVRALQAALGALVERLSGLAGEPGQLPA